MIGSTNKEIIYIDETEIGNSNRTINMVRDDTTQKELEDLREKLKTYEDVEKQKEQQQRLRSNLNKRRLELDEQNKEARKYFKIKVDTNRKQYNVHDMISQWRLNVSENVSSVKVSQVNRLDKSIFIKSLSEIKGPVDITEVSYYNEIGDGEGLVSDLISNTLDEIVAKYGIVHENRYLPPPDNVVANNAHIRRQLITCGKLMQIGLLNNNIMAKWVPYAYTFCLHPNPNELVGLRTIFGDEISKIFKNNLDRTTLAKYNCEYLETYESKDSIVHHIMYYSRRLAYCYLREGFIGTERLEDQTNNTNIAFSLCNITNLQKYITKVQNGFLDYNGDALVDGIIYKDYSSSSDYRKMVITEFITGLHQEELYKLIKLWTGTEMVTESSD